MKIDEKIRCIRKYFWYLSKHRFFVMIECFKHGMIWRGLVHDLSKYNPKEFFPYAYHFYKDNRPKRDPTGYYKPTDTGNPVFELAWVHHIHNNKHHWQWWTIPTDGNGKKTYPISEKFCKEMICDWTGAHKAQKTKGSVIEWYMINKDKMLFHEKSKIYIEHLLNIGW
jgi:hypothetical protein